MTQHPKSICRNCAKNCKIYFVGRCHFFVEVGTSPNDKSIEVIRLIRED